MHRYLFCSCSEVTVFWVNIRRLGQGRSALVYLMDLSSCFTATLTQAGSDPHNKKGELSCWAVSSADEQVSADSCQVAGITSCSMCWLPVLATCSFFFVFFCFFFPPRLLRWQCVWWVCVLRLLQCYRFCRCQCWFWQLDADVGGVVGFAASMTEEKILIYWTRCQFNLQGVLL